MTMLINGQSTDQLDAQDRGLHYGDGLFTSARIHAGAPALWEQHWRRLREGCERLNIPAPPRAVLDDEVRRVCAGMERGVLKIIVTRGSGGRGYKAPEIPVPTRVIRAYPWPDYPPAWWSEGVVARVCSTRLGSAPALAGIKHLNRLEHVLARSEWNDVRIAEGLLLDEASHVIEGVSANVFAVRAGILCTPDLTRCGVRGVMRETILELARKQGIETCVAPLTRCDVEQADEIFFTNSVIGLWPVRQLNEKTYAVGPLTHHLATALGRTAPAYS